MRRLDKFVRTIEKRRSPEANFHEAVDHEHAISPALNGRTVLDDKKRPRPAQLDLFRNS